MSRRKRADKLSALRDQVVNVNWKIEEWCANGDHPYDQVKSYPTDLMNYSGKITEMDIFYQFSNANGTLL